MSYARPMPIHFNTIQVVGQITQYFFPNPAKTVFSKWKLSKLGSCCLIVIIWQTFDQAFGAGAFTSVKSSNMIFIVFISIGYFLVWLIVCLALSIPWLSKKDTIAVAYCVPAKTPAMGVPLANVMFTTLTPLQQAKIQIPLVIFQGLQIAFSSVLTIFFRKWVSSEEAKEPANVPNTLNANDAV